ncbi:SDR family NAD(P)-dependent oxidoreductase [Nakamurella lactea]|uniref:SDR family NAD(P)-dependent oxidoreductase n=1 Tax=Nakamurella lactea TaxID=459515 RepID=UPI0009FD0503|nr:SDR family oxidoreductase [Nakamurella lactea]
MTEPDVPGAGVPQDFGGRTGVAVVTGGSGGIGAAICRHFAARGAAVALTYRSNSAAARSLVEELTGSGADVRADPLDLTEPAAVAEYLHTVGSAGIHTVVHAAGPHIPMVHLSKVTPTQYADHLNQEAAAFFNLVQAALPTLRAGGGSVVAVTTAATSRYPVRDGLSAGTKGAVEALVRAFAAEEGRFGVRLNCVGPGMLTDGMAERLMSSGDLNDRAQAVAMANIPLRRFGSADDIAAAVTFLASDQAGFITGQKLDVDGGYGI